MTAMDPASGRVIAEQPAPKTGWPFALPGGRILYSDFDEQLFETRVDPANGRWAGQPQLRSKYLLIPEKSITASADGLQVAGVYSGKHHPHVSVASLSPLTSRLEDIQQVTFDDYEYFPHAWTPDGKGIVLESARLKNYDIYIQHLDRRSPTALVVMPRHQVVPMVSPDGKWVLFLSGPVVETAAERRWDLLRVPMQGGTPETVPTGGPVQEFGCMFGARRCVVREQQNDQSVFYDLDPVRGKGRELARAATGRRVFGDWSLSPDGTMVAMPIIDRVPAAIRVIYLDRALEKEVSIDGPPPMGGIAWNGNGKGWFFAVQDEQMRQVDWQGRNRFVHDVDYWVVPSPDGKRVAFLDHPRDSNIWMLDERRERPR
jgi:hypothetical protein